MEGAVLFSEILAKLSGCTSRKALTGAWISLGPGLPTLGEKIGQSATEKKKSYEAYEEAVLLSDTGQTFWLCYP
jgi:hypothetical protein